MTPVGRNPALGSIRFILIVSVGAGLALGIPLTRIGDGAIVYPVAAVVSIVALLVLIVGIVAALYRPFGWDEQSGTASFGGRTVPMASVTRAIRSLSTGGNGATYLTYRFVSTEGPSVRVLVAGTPLKGLDADGLARLRRFIDAAPIADPPRGDELSDQQMVIVDALSETGGKSEVGKRLLLAELDEVLAPGSSARASQADLSADPTGGPAATDPLAPPVPGGSVADEPAPGPVLTTAQVADVERRWQEDDADALAYLAAHPASAAVARRAFFWLIIVAALAAVAALVFAVVAEQTRGSLLDSDTNGLVGIAILGAALVGVLAYLLWCIAADVHVRQLQSTAAAWLQTRDPDQRIRGLAAPLLVAWAQPAPGTRSMRALSFTGAVVGAILLIGGIVVLVGGDEPGPLAGIVLGLVGAAMITVCIVGFVVSARRRREGHRQLVIHAGWRLIPPAIEEDGALEGSA